MRFSFPGLWTREERVAARLLSAELCLACIHVQATSEGQMEGQILIRSEVVVGAGVGGWALEIEAYM